MKNKKYKFPSESETIKTEVVCPTDTNPMGMLKGGQLILWMDMAAAGCAQIHSDMTCVTAAISRANFIAFAETGDIITIKAKLTRVFNTSMEVFANAFARKVKGSKNQLICEVYFVFVSLDDKGNPINAPELKPVTESEKKQFAGARHRRNKYSASKNMEPGVYKYEKKAN